jgi:RNA polymerase sigma-32 factor
MADLDPGTSRFIDQARRFPKLDAATELELLEAWRTRRDRGAADRLVSAHLRDVAFQALRYRHYGVPVGDLISEGNMGLMHALNKFEPKHGTRFGTYAAYWIRAYLVTHVLRSWSIVRNRTGVLRTKLFFKLRRERARLQTLHGDGAETHRLLAERMNVSEERLTRMLTRIDVRDVSLDAPAHADSSVSLVDQLPSTEDQETSYAFGQVKEGLARAIHDVLPRLDDRERFIVKARWMADDEMSLADIGRKLGVSRERARQLECRARKKVQEALTTHHGATSDWLCAATAA